MISGRFLPPIPRFIVLFAAFFAVLQLHSSIAGQTSAGKLSGSVNADSFASVRPQSSGSATTRSAAERQKLYADHKNDFDYLLGDWEFTGANKIYGNFHGYWSTVRFEPGGQILDEYRVVGDKGETEYSTSTVREYNPALARWELISMEGSDGLQNFGTGNLENGEMHIEQKFGAMSPKPILLRIRYHDIQSNHFLWNADRSTDNGKTWEKDYMQLDVHRIGPSRSIGPLIKGNGANARD